MAVTGGESNTYKYTLYIYTKSSECVLVFTQ